MTRSMTAFARREEQTEQGDLTWEIRSVNHRYLETSLRLDERFRPLEMKMKTLSLLAGVGAPLIATASVQAGFVGIKTTEKENAFGLLVVNVYAIFDRPDPGDGSGDHMVAVAGTPNAPMNIQVNGGTFYNSAFGGDQAPNAAFFPTFPSLAFDTFVTIGKKTSTGDTLTITPGFPLGITGSSLAGTTFGWAVIPTAPQGDPFDAANSFPGNGQILIGQFSTADGTSIKGTMLVQYVSNGQSGTSIVSFGLPTPGTLALFGAAGLIGRRRRRR